MLMGTKRCSLGGPVGGTKVTETQDVPTAPMAAPVAALTGDRRSLLCGSVGSPQVKEPQFVHMVVPMAVTGCAYGCAHGCAWESRQKLARQSKKKAASANRKRSWVFHAYLLV